MTRDDIIELAKNAAEQAPREDWNTNAWVFGEEMLEYFAHLVAAAERVKRPRQWQGLTDEDREEILQWVEWKEIGSQSVAPQKLIAYVEKKLREKNT